jgi:hypothetical protein
VKSLETELLQEAQRERPEAKSSLDVEIVKERTRQQARDIVQRERRGKIPLNFLDLKALLARVAKRWMVHGLIPESGLVSVIAAPGSYKTFLALCLALSSAAGFSSWLGRKLNIHGPVVYVAGEGQGRFKYRVMAWLQVHKITSDLPFYLLDNAVDLRDDDLMARFREAIEALGQMPVLIVFDTLARNTPGTEENSAKELGQAIHQCDLLREASGATVLILHHPRKDGLSARGSGAGLGAMDGEIWLVKKDKDLVEFSTTKVKEGDDDIKLTLKRRIIQLDGVFEPDSGEPVTSCVLHVATDTELQIAAASLGRRILDFVTAHPDCKREDVYRGLKVKESDARGTIDLMVKDGRLTETKGQGKAHRAKLLRAGLATAQNDFAP